MDGTIRINADLILNHATFHDVFAEVFGFPSFYGRNMNAWIDCLSYLDDPSAEMTAVHVKEGEVLALLIDNAEALKARSPEVFSDLIECAAFVNWRRVQSGA